MCLDRNREPASDREGTQTYQEIISNFPKSSMTELKCKNFRAEGYKIVGKSSRTWAKTFFWQNLPKMGIIFCNENCVKPNCSRFSGGIPSGLGDLDRDRDPPTTDARALSVSVLKSVESQIKPSLERDMIQRNTDENFGKSRTSQVPMCTGRANAGAPVSLSSPFLRD